jgi:hypothetical protein
VRRHLHRPDRPGIGQDRRSARTSPPTRSAGRACTG